MNAVHCFDQFLRLKGLGEGGMEGRTMVINPKLTVMHENITRGPNMRTRIVAGSWNVTDATVYTRIEIDYIHLHYQLCSECPTPSG